MCRSRTCPECGDALIHQTQRGPHESSSPFGQFIHNSLGNTFYRVDDDQASHYKRATKVLRHIEHKFTGQIQSPGQVVVMAKWALAIRELVYMKDVHPESGSFVVYSDPPFTRGVIHRVDPGNGALGDGVALTDDDWGRFLTGLEIGA